MRVKLNFVDFPTSKQRKVCYLINRDSCKKVADLCYLINKRFLSTNGSVSIYIDDFYCPPQEDISIVHENDILTVRSYKKAKDIVTESSSQIKKRKLDVVLSSSESSSDSSSSVSSVASSNTKNKKRKTEEASKSEKTAPKTCTKTSTKVPIKKNIPISKLAYQSTNIRISSSSSETESECEKNLKKLHKNTSLLKKEPVKITASKRKVPSSSDSSGSSSSSDSSSGSSADEDAKHSVKTVSQNTTKIDFNVSNLSKLPVSTPIATPSPRGKPVTKSKLNKDHIAKSLAANDRYTNTSNIYVNNSSLVSNNNTSVSVENFSRSNLKNSEGASMNESKEKTSVLEEVVEKQNAVENSLQTSGKTLRNRRRRQRRLELIRSKKTGNADNGCENLDGSVSDDLKGSSEVKKDPSTDNGDTKLKENKEPLVLDYSTYPEITEVPSKGNLIAYKVLEISMSYTPELSCYKEAIVNDYDAETGLLELKLSTVSMRKSRGDGNITGRFELESEENGQNGLPDLVSVKWTDLKDTRLIL